MPEPSVTPCPNPQLQDAVSHLFVSWLHDCRQQAAAYLASNGNTALPAQLAAACPAMMANPAVAAWAMEQNAHGLSTEEIEHECGTAVLREPLPLPA